MYLTDLADVLRKAGLEVVEVPGWKTRGRPGAFDPKGVLCHHTAGAGDGYADAVSMATKGRPDLKPPLAQLALSRKGVFYVLAAGRANHAGRCKAIGGLTPYPGGAYGDGNEQMIGIEAQNRGTDAEGWEPTQYDAYVRGVAAITKHYGWSIVFGHKETSTSGKVDPDFPMDKFRRDVAATGTATGTATTPTAAPQEEDDMFTDTDEGRLNYVANTVGPRVATILAEVTRTRAELAGLTTAVQTLAANVGVDPALIVAAVDKAVRDRLSTINVDLVVTDGGA